MIHSAALRLTLAYLFIIMLLSIGFSTSLYHISTHELDRGLRRPPFLSQAADSPYFNFEQLRHERLSESSEKLRLNLILFNLGTLMVGGVVSYALARRTLRPIEESMEAQSRFTADASHELRTPLTAMQTEIEVALRKPNLTKVAAKDLLRSNLEEVSKLKNLSEGLLSLAHPDGRSLTLANVPADEMAMEALNQMLKAAQAKNVSINNKVTPLIIKADKDALTEALVILLDNAVKYSDPGSAITLESGQHGHQAFIKIADTGHGIKASDLPHIFERFYRADPSRSKDKVEGYGLGLAIAQKIVKLHNGSIEAKSLPAKGSEFTIKLPIG